ncbi:MAG: uracil phosphoribosyltransferase [Candidatus Sericytochromatia bacterium]|nr:MAG: uracil phosphoribosyltransferase [Candidatus Sericytochromatia bacterium]
MEKFNNLFICDNPLVKVLITELRDINTQSVKFRRLIREISRYIVYESLRDVELTSIEVKTPLDLAKGYKFSNKFILAPILRAGLSMIDGAIDTLTDSQIRHIGLYRNEETLEPVEYYVKLPDNIPDNTIVIIMDPMLATGGSAISAIKTFKKRNAKNIKYLSVIASIQGVKNVLENYPDIKIFTGALDNELNRNGYIVPGLGDAGDRCFGT